MQVYFCLWPILTFIFSYVEQKVKTLQITVNLTFFYCNLDNFHMWKQICNVKQCFIYSIVLAAKHIYIYIYNKGKQLFDPLLILYVCPLKK